MNDVTPHHGQQHTATLELLNTEVTARLARQSAAGSSIDTKAVILIGYAGAASSFLTTRHAVPVLAALAYTAYGMAAGFGIWASAVRVYQDVPDPRQLLNRCHALSKAQVLTALAATRVAAFESNARRNDRKVRWWRISVVSLVVGVTLMIFALTGTYW